MSEKQFDIEAKLTALLELSKESANGTEHEQKAALEMAIRLAAKYGISLTKLAQKRQKYAGADWFEGAGQSTTEDVEYTDERYTEVQIRRWCDAAESYGWERYKRDYHEKEGLTWMYRQPDRTPKVELRIFERPWGDIEFEVVRNPDPIIGQLEQWMNMGFDCIDLGVTYQDFDKWLQRDRQTPVR